MTESGRVSADFWFRQRSFSLVYFAGATPDDLPALLIRCGYAIIGEARYDASVPDIIDAIEAVEGPRNTIVRKAIYAIPGGSVLLDPEMTVAFLHHETLAQFCAEHRVEACAVGWERVSESVFARHIEPGGIVADVILVAGALQGTPINPPTGIMRAPGPASLRDFLAAAGASPDEVFGSVSARLFKLDESAPAPGPH